jgi:hypothetical protein
MRVRNWTLIRKRANVNRVSIEAFSLLMQGGKGIGNGVAVYHNKEHIVNIFPSCFPLVQRLALTPMVSSAPFNRGSRGRHHPRL